MREKLIELLTNSVVENTKHFDQNFCCVTTVDYNAVADHLIANGVTIQKWIPVTERLPDKNGEYLVSGAWHGEPAKTWICEFVVIGNVGGWANPARKPVVTHWMPLPEPPKEE